MSCLVSIIIPVFNGEKTLIPCVKSILDQEYLDFELLLVDNGSTDNTKEIILSFCNLDKRVRYLCELKKGRGAARRAGETASVGDIILMTDVDCIVPQDWISNMIKPIIFEECECVQGYQEPLLINFWTKNIQHSHLLNIQNTIGRSLIGFIDTKNFAIKRELLSKIGFTSDKYHSGNDLYLAIRLEDVRINVLFLESVKVRHFHPDNGWAIISKQYNRARWCVLIAKDMYSRVGLSTQRNIEKAFCQSWLNHLLSVGGTIFISIRDSRNIFFEIIHDVSWRAGLIYGYWRMK